MEEIKRVVATPLAKEWLRRLENIHGPILIYQSGESAPLCMMKEDFKLADSDVRLGMIDNVPVYISSTQVRYWEHTQLILDVVKGDGSDSSLESPEGVSFHTRTHVFQPEELPKLRPIVPEAQI